MSERYTTKYICPRHSPVIRDNAIGGRCQQCGGDRVRCNVTVDDDGHWTITSRIATTAESTVVFLSAMTGGLLGLVFVNSNSTLTAIGLTAFTAGLFGFAVVTTEGAPSRLSSRPEMEGEAT